MASVFGHVAVAFAMGKTLTPQFRSSRFWWLTIACCLLPDVDVMSFWLGIPYEHVLGHRGFTHSIVFAMLLGLIVARLADPMIPYGSRRYWVFSLYFFLVTLSHGILDAFTDGGLGIAFFAPFDSGRYFFPWRPIAVSPIGIAQFFSEYGMAVVLSELLWIGIPVGLWLTLLKLTVRTTTDRAQG